MLQEVFMSETKSRLAVVTGYDQSYIDIAEASVPNKKAYCDLHGFELLVYEGEPLAGRTSHWSKILWLSQSLPKADWLFWSDADSIICDKNVSLAHWIDRADPHVNLIIAEDLLWIGAKVGDFTVNTGNFFLRSCEWSEILLSEIWFTYNKKYHSEPYHEQSVLAELLDTRGWVKRHTYVVPLKEFNSLPSVYSPKDFMNHFAGHDSLGDKSRKIREFLQSCDKSSLPWPSSV